jgi:hypothetical protein
MIEKIMSKFKIYTTTKGKKEDTLLYDSLSIDYYDVPVYYKENNKESLQKSYNEFLDDAYANGVDIACFVHDDVFINCNDLLHRLQDPAKKYTVFGLAGATTCKVKEPALWHLMSERQDQRGCVAHGNKELYHYTSFGPLPSRSLVIDGVFLGINIKKFNRDVRFDESYPSYFHYYDIDFCLECNKNNVIMGIVDIPIIHSSPGLTNPNKQFYEGQKYFINKWKK